MILNVEGCLDVIYKQCEARDLLQLILSLVSGGLLCRGFCVCRGANYFSIFWYTSCWRQFPLFLHDCALVPFTASTALLPLTLCVERA